MIRLHSLSPLAVAVAAFVAAPTVCAQSRAEQVAAAVERWLAGDAGAREQLDSMAKVLLEDPKDGIAWLAAELTKAAAAPNEARAKAVRSLLAPFTIEYMRRQRATNITFQGQYAALEPLQPAVGEMLFGLLLETPDWFPITQRIHVVPVLRDLQPRLPDSGCVEGVVQIVENAKLEPEGLRRALAALLWQWGKKQHAQEFVRAMVTATGEGHAEDRVQTTLDLADYYNQLREYKLAANTHRSAQTLAKTSNLQLKPIAWYSAACVQALLGDADRGFAALDECARQLASPDLDSSLRLPRSMFDNDPELASLRKDARWAEVMRKAFPASAGSPGGR